MRARVWVLAAVVPRLMRVVKERSSFLRRLIGCAVLAMHKRYRKGVSLSINLNYRVLSVNENQNLHMRSANTAGPYMGALSWIF